MTDMLAARTRYIDAFFAEAQQDGKAAGIRQVVILAVGLDARGYRLPWAPGTTVFEIDQPQVIGFMTATISALGAEPTADVRAVAIDLRHDWPSALRQAGFDSDRPAAWAAEGLLGFLPPEAQDRLLDSITALSADGSQLVAKSSSMGASIRRLWTPRATSGETTPRPLARRSGHSRRTQRRRDPPRATRLEPDSHIAESVVGRQRLTAAVRRRRRALSNNYYCTAVLHKNG